MARALFPQINIYTLKFLNDFGIDMDSFVDAFIANRVIAFHEKLKICKLKINFPNLTYTLNMPESYDQFDKAGTYGIYNNGYHDVFKYIGKTNVCKDGSLGILQSFFESYLKNKVDATTKQKVVETLQNDFRNLYHHNYSAKELIEKNVIIRSRKLAYRINKSRKGQIKLTLLKKTIYKKDYFSIISGIVAVIFRMLVNKLKISLLFVANAIAKHVYTDKLLTKLSAKEVIAADKYKILAAKCKLSNSRIIVNFLNIAEIDREPLMNGLSTHPYILYLLLKNGLLTKFAEDCPRNPDSSLFVDISLAKQMIKKSIVQIFSTYHTNCKPALLVRQLVKDDKKINKAIEKLISEYSKFNFIKDNFQLSFDKVFLMMSIPESLEKICCKDKKIFALSVKFIQDFATFLHYKMIEDKRLKLSLHQILVLKNQALAMFLKSKNLQRVIASTKSDNVSFLCFDIGVDFKKVTIKTFIGETGLFFTQENLSNIANSFLFNTLENNCEKLANNGLKIHSCKVACYSEKKDLYFIKTGFTSEKYKGAVLYFLSYLNEGSRWHTPEFKEIGNKKCGVVDTRFISYVSNKTNMKHVAMLEDFSKTNINLNHVYTEAFSKLFEAYPGNEFAKLL